MKENALVSVVIPTKNRSVELRRAINSVLKQTHQHFEVLVVDDQSEEDIKGVVVDFDDERVKYLDNTTQVSNANVCRNIGVKEARGEYIAMLDSDDEWLPIHLESKINFVKTHGCDGVFGSAFIDDGESKRLKLSRDFLEGELPLDYILGDGSAQTSSYFFVANSAKKVDWDENLRRHQDYDFFAQFFRTFSFLPSQDPTSIIHWRKGEYRNQDVSSQVLFLLKNKHNMSINTYVKYVTSSYAKLAGHQGFDSKEAEFFKRESLKLIPFLSLSDFQLIQPNGGKFEKVVQRLKYVIYVLFS
ncbi:MAG: glycosyltransferase family 2 protein [Flavobacteriales bacterium]